MFLYILYSVKVSIQVQRLTLSKFSCCWGFLSLLKYIKYLVFQPQLVDLMGKEKFDEYAGKIWQLKFCEDSLYKV